MEFEDAHCLDIDVMFLQSMNNNLHAMQGRPELTRIAWCIAYALMGTSVLYCWNIAQHIIHVISTQHVELSHTLSHSLIPSH